MGVSKSMVTEKILVKIGGSQKNWQNVGRGLLKAKVKQEDDKGKDMKLSTAPEYENIKEKFNQQ